MNNSFYQATPIHIKGEKKAEVEIVNLQITNCENCNNCKTSSKLKSSENNFACSLYCSKLDEDVSYNYPFIPDKCPELEK